MTPKTAGNTEGIHAQTAEVATVHTVEVGAQGVVTIAIAGVRVEAASRRVKAIEQKEGETGKYSNLNC